MVIGDTDSLPDRLGLKIRFKSLLGVTFKVGHVQPVLRKTINAGEKIPSHSDSFLLHELSAQTTLISPHKTYLEVVAKGPVTEHFEERVVIRVLSNVVEV